MKDKARPKSQLVMNCANSCTGKANQTPGEKKSNFVLLRFSMCVAEAEPSAESWQCSENAF